MSSDEQAKSAQVDLEFDVSGYCGLNWLGLTWRKRVQTGIFSLCVRQVLLWLYVFIIWAGILPEAFLRARKWVFQESINATFSCWFSQFLFIDLPHDLSLEPCSCEPGVSGVSDASAYEFKRTFIVIGIDEDEFFEAKYEDEFSELEQEFIGKW